eukprot:CAMPEP_0184301800 /NCGR_PEP_ID=MMETSP1049-20130417/11917_1 /TAXON_ID=77928 /ORGANISM="Proteomonas sulcata, Strain CCMP704" /LENGTH=125 /DNA_ID=CAMNT_0026612903 /DNA_START=58 /DNA_END=435 /DNA_ORIENTATION=+
MLGETLRQSMEELEQDGKLTDHEKNIIWERFDHIINDSLSGVGVLEEEKNRALCEWYEGTKVTFKGHLHMFRGVDDVWTLLLTEGKTKQKDGTDKLEKVSVKCEGNGQTETIELEGLKVVAMQRK